MKPHSIAILIAGLFLAACDATGGLGVKNDKVPGIDPSGKAVGGRIVGDRLMAAGEPELALKSYLRATAEEGVNPVMLTSIGSANLALGRIGQAEEMFRRALKMDEAFVPALNNLGVVLMERGEYGEARVIFQQAYALDSGQTDSIRDNLKLAIARSESNVYDPETKPKGEFRLLREEQGKYVLLTHL